MSFKQWMLWVSLVSVVTLYPSQAMSSPHPSSLVQPSVPQDTTFTVPKPRTRIKRKLLRKGTVYIKVKVIYAHVRKTKYIDPKLKRDVPSLSKSFDFNAYKLLKTYRYKTKYQQAVIIPISYRFQIQLSPQWFVKKRKRIALQATFLYRKRSKRSGLPSRFRQYASTRLLIKSGSQVAFLGPSIKLGRALLTIRAKHKP